MDTEKRFFTGLDLGTSNFRVAIVAANPSSTPDNNSQDAPNGETTSLSVVGYNASPAAGMRKGVPIDLNTPAELIDRFLGEAERMAGYDVTSAYVSVNGSSVTSTVTEGLISLSSPDHEVTPDDLARLEDITIDSCNLKNREILDVVPLEYALDGQAGITDPLSMAGSRLEMRLGITSALTQVCENLRKPPLPPMSRLAASSPMPWLPPVPSSPLSKRKTASLSLISAPPPPLLQFTRRAICSTPA